MADKSPIRKFLDKQSIYLVMYGHIEALRLNNLQFSVESAILNFISKHGIDEGDFNIETAKTTYKRMNAEYLQSQKSGS